VGSLWGLLIETRLCEMIDSIWSWKGSLRHIAPQTARGGMYICIRESKFWHVWVSHTQEAANPKEARYQLLCLQHNTFGRNFKGISSLVHVSLKRVLQSQSTQSQYILPFGVVVGSSPRRSVFPFLFCKFTRLEFQFDGDIVSSALLHCKPSAHSATTIRAECFVAWISSQSVPRIHILNKGKFSAAARGNIICSIG
jgi:hypothetical protein